MTKKLIISTFIILSILLSTLTAADFNVKNALNAYNHNLCSQSIGVVESSLMYISKLKFEYPDENYKPSISRINYLISKKPDMTLHYKLYVTKLLLTETDYFIKNAKLLNTEEPSEFFISISKNLLKSMDISQK